MSRDRELPELSVFADALAAELAARAEPPVPDYADMLARAAAMADAPLADGLRDGLEVDDELDADEAPAPDLARFTAALRERNERHLADRALAPIPAPEAAPARWPSVTVAVAAVAAIFVLAFVLVPRLAPTRAEAIGEQVRSAAAQSMGGAAPERAVHEHAVEPPKPMPSPELVVEPQPEPETVAPEATPEPESTAPRAKRSRPTIDELEAQARAAWASGELAEAERLFREVIRRDKRGRRSELAFGDLFSLAKQRAGQDGQAKVWREYLGKFPRGRFADDARAGLCRRADPYARHQCWSDYLAAHPEGSHADLARKLVGEPERPE